MVSKRKCQSCGKRFPSDYRINGRQQFCGDAECQRRRRTDNQRSRRNRTKHGGTVKRLLKPSDAAWLRRNPLLVGLISVLIDSSDLGDIQRYYSALVHRGSKILTGEL